MTWRKEVVQRYFIQMDIEAILQIPLSLRMQDDCWAWHYEKNGIFSARSAYRMLVLAKKAREDYFEGRAICSNELFRQKEWKSLCDLKVP
jgi:hypothetical protein